jgi:hypothetical protein
LSGGVVALAAAGALAFLSEVPHTAQSADQALLRFSWRARGELVRECRRRTPDELANVPVHMRQEEVCARRILPYRLRVTLDGAVAIDELVRAGGAQADRPLFVFRELPLVPGQHRVAITFERERTGEERHDEDAEDQRERSARETPLRLALEQAITVGPGAIVLVTYDDDRQRLRLLAAPPSGP